MVCTLSSPDQRFIEVTQTPERFFKILPDDWQESIIPYWLQYQDTARVYTIEYGGEVLCGGIIFSTNPPETPYASEAIELFQRGYLYIGFLWVSEKHRGRKLGLEWIEKIRNQYPLQNFWLAIDEYWLKTFYERIGFHVVKEVPVESGSEWILKDGPVGTTAGSLGGPPAENLQGETYI